MTVTTTNNVVVLETNGATTVFPFNFKVIEPEHLSVERRDPTTLAIEKTYSASEYVLTGLGSNSGSVTISPAPVDGKEIVIRRTVPYRQDLDLVNQGGFYPETVEEQLDLIAMQIQQTAEAVGRAPKVPFGEAALSMASLAEANGKVLGIVEQEIVPVENNSVAAAQSAAAALVSEQAAAGYKVGTAADLQATTSLRAQVAADLVATTAAKVTAEDARDMAVAAQGIYATTTEGLAATSDGDVFGIPSASVQGSVDLYQNDGGSAVDTGKTLPNTSYVAEAIAGVKPYLVGPAAGSALNRLLELNLYTKAGGVDIEWPANLHVREIAASGSNQFRFRIGGGDTVTGDGGYPQIAAETSNAAAAGATSGGSLARTYAGLTSEDQLLLYASDTSLGVPKGTVIGTYRVKFDGTAFGTYFPFTVFTYAAGGLTRSRILPTMATIANMQAVVENALRSEPDDTPWLPSVTDEALRYVIEDVWAERGVPGRNYVIRLAYYLTGGNYILSLEAYDPVRGAVIAKGGQGRNYDWKDEIPESMVISGASLGSPRGDVEWVGTDFTVFIRPGSITEWNRPYAATTSVAAAGMKANRVMSREEAADRVRTGRGIRNKVQTYGPGGDFASLKEAVDSHMNFLAGTGGATPDNYQRSWYPFSNTATISNQVELVAMPGHTETKLPVIPSGVSFARGIPPWMGLTIRGLDDTEVTAEGDGGVTTYLFDYNLGGRILGAAGTLWSADSAQAVHQDAGSALSIPSSANANDPTAGQQFFQIVGRVQGGTFRSTVEQAWNAGTSDDQHIEVRDAVMETLNPAKANMQTHTSAANKNSGLYLLDGVTFKGGTGQFVCNTLNTVVARHRIKVANSDIEEVFSGGAGYVRVGKNAGTTYSVTLAP